MRSRRTPAGRTGRRLRVLVGAAASMLLAGASMLTGAPTASAAPVTETDDYSRATDASFTDAPRVTVHVDGALVWGTAP
ncbi:hypothetical protein ACFWOJ_26000 [Streptomyces sp. NPDC058439]|uniref:hypothetical protein n=1 Tax=Streptomyces sp. NPDC058439 TaxID=3346500 RepID=UPI00365991F5